MFFRNPTSLKPRYVLRNCYGFKTFRKLTSLKPRYALRNCFGFMLFRNSTSLKPCYALRNCYGFMLFRNPASLQLSFALQICYGFICFRKFHTRKHRLVQIFANVVQEHILLAIKELRKSANDWNFRNSITFYITSSMYSINIFIIRYDHISIVLLQLYLISILHPCL